MKPVEPVKVVEVGVGYNDRLGHEVYWVTTTDDSDFRLSEVEVWIVPPGYSVTKDS